VPRLEQDVLRLHVAVHDAVTMRVAQGVGHLAGDRQRVVNGELALPSEPVAQGFPLHQRHDVIEEAAGFTGVVEREDVGMPQPADDFDLAQESLAAEGSGDL
jgi:hypothetical protein